MQPVNGCYIHIVTCWKRAKCIIVCSSELHVLFVHDPSNNLKYFKLINFSLVANVLLVWAVKLTWSPTPIQW